MEGKHIDFREYKSSAYWMHRSKTQHVLDFVGLAIAGAVLAACLIGRVWA